MSVFTCWIEGEDVDGYVDNAPDARTAAEVYVARLEARRVSFPIASGNESIVVYVKSGGSTWDVEVSGDPHPNYASRILRGTGWGERATQSRCDSEGVKR